MEIQTEKKETSPARRGRSKRKGLFLRGIVTLLPAALTLFVFLTILQFGDTYLAKPINGAMYGFLEGNSAGWGMLHMMELDPYEERFFDREALTHAEDWDLWKERLLTYGEGDLDKGWGTLEFATALENDRRERETFLRDHRALYIDAAALREAAIAAVPTWLGPLLGGLLIVVLGYLAGGFLGRRIIAAFDRALQSLPVVRSVYPYAKQVVDFFLSEKEELQFDTVVLAPYPSEGVWAIGLVTGPGLRTLDEAQDARFLSVFIPTSPMPMTGFTVFLPADRLIPLDISVDEALRITVSAGVLVPPREMPENAGAWSAKLGRPPKPKSAA